MNIKEAFRYQRFLDQLLNEAGASICTTGHCVTTTKLHNIKEADPASEDKEEVVDEGEFFKNDDVISFMQRLIEERAKLTTAISEAKRHLNGSIDDMDVANETNKFRRSTAARIKTMLSRTKPGKKVERGTGYKFNAEGNQMAFYYNIDVTTAENFDRAKAKSVMQALLKAADETSAAIDEAQVNTTVDYEAPWDVNDSFEDVMTQFCEADKEPQGT